ncbi:hypothetical protein C9374_005874 [Naegleria lovaniensis]|uniref:NAD(P)-binding domain-containing protein n=1 Tax=Naegleria lovaniensis TaxID=51637 RepID=A0AA88KID1_NAELO|nr:uncharacterized protein C9374_005874 [Naegleria lovaniensis]KAG2382082.1 hypothetical protein C9374_005874 [Naegleria lovaniensis]
MFKNSASMNIIDASNSHSAAAQFFKKLKKSKEPTKPYSVMITGGAGFIGSHIAEHFVRNEPLCERIVIYDNLHATAQSSGNPNVNTNSNLEFLYSLEQKLNSKKIVFVKESIMDRSVFRDTLKKYNIRYVYHLAALVSVPESMKFPQMYFQVNTMGTDIVLEESRKSGHVKKVVLSSSAAIYGLSQLYQNLRT